MEAEDREYSVEDLGPGSPGVTSFAEAQQGDQLPEDVVLAFLPLHKRAFGLAVGMASALSVAGITALHILIRPQPAIDLSPLAEYFYGYSVSWPGMFVGAFWAFLSGFVAGWFCAFCRNLVLATQLFIGRTRAELAATRDFLDHI